MKLKEKNYSEATSPLSFLLILAGEIQNFSLIFLALDSETGGTQQTALLFRAHGDNHESARCDTPDLLN